MTNRRIGHSPRNGFLLALVAAGCLAAPAASTAQTPSLAGEVLSSTGFTVSSPGCSPAGTSRFEFSAQGQAAGPYPGTFTESGRLTIGPQEQPSRFPELTEGPVTTLEAQFRIVSGSTTITGTKRLRVPAGAAMCFESDSGIPGLQPICDFNFPPGLISRLERYAVSTPVSYSAVVSGPNGPITLTGDGRLAGERLNVQCPSGLHTSAAFNQAFATSTVVDDRPQCKVTAGGWIRAGNGDRASFGGNAHPGSPARGQQTYVDHGPAGPTKVASIAVSDVRCSQDRTRATVYGTAKVNGAGSRTFQVDVTDQGQPGKADTYRIRVGAYDSGTQRLGGGNVQIHR